MFGSVDPRTKRQAGAEEDVRPDPSKGCVSGAPRPCANWVFTGCKVSNFGAHFKSRPALPDAAVSLAAILAELGDSWEEIGSKQKVRQWYWCGVLGELYGGAVESRHARDLPECLSSIQDGGPTPTTVTGSSFNPDRLLTLRTRNSAAYKGIYALLMQRGGREFLTDVPISFQTYGEEKIDIHHIFPKAWRTKHEIQHKRMDCVVNKTALSARTNRITGGAAPSTYLRSLEKRGNVSITTTMGFYQLTSFRQNPCAQIISTHFSKCGTKLFWT